MPSSAVKAIDSTSFPVVSCHAAEGGGWTPQKLERLRALWAKGLSTADIGREIGMTKNAVVGKAHRIGLPSRPSPIRQVAIGQRFEDRRKAAVRQPLAVGAATLPALASLPIAGLAVSAPEAAAPVLNAKGRTCCYPLWDDATPRRDRRLCEALAQQGSTYCPGHHRICWRPVRRNLASVGPLA